MTNSEIKTQLTVAVSDQINQIVGRHNQAPSEHGQAAVAAALMAVAEGLHNVALAIREGRSE